MKVTKIIETCKEYISRECDVYQIVGNPRPIFDTNFINIIKGYLFWEDNVKLSSVFVCQNIGVG